MSMHRTDGRKRRSATRPDERGMGGFYEAIMAMVIVTCGVMLLTVSLTFLSVEEVDGDALDRRCDAVLSSIIGNTTWSRGTSMLDHSVLVRANWTTMLGEGGARIMLTYPDGTTEVLHQQGEMGDGERSGGSAPVNLYFHQADVRAALLTVWVWA